MSSSPPIAIFYPIPAYPPGGFDPELINQMINAILQAMSKAISSGVAEYHVGSRGLKRFTLKELTDLLAFWKQQELLTANGGSSMMARRGVPTDY